MSEIDVSKCTRYCNDTGKCTAFKSQYLCTERKNCYTKRLIRKQAIIQQLKEDNASLNRTIISWKEYVKDDLLPTRQRLEKENERYSNCLDEIEEIVKETQVYSSNPIHDKILRKIKEVKGNDKI